MNPCNDGDGYLVVTVRKDNKPFVARVHRLVAKTFIPNPNELPIVRHLDDSKQNNHASNLAWGTVQDNASDAIRNGLTLKGEANPANKLTEGEVLYIRSVYPSYTQQWLADYFGVSKGHINNIIKRRVWKHV